ncbi:MAG: hypothetical protein IJV85_00960 [Clostridia bacterium]|nr:hypothetical protein [Clostridia bacterium]
MNEEIEYAEMLEIPVSTVNVVKNTPRGRKRKLGAASSAETVFSGSDIKESVIAQINGKIDGSESPSAQIRADAELFAEGANSQGEVLFDVPDRIDTIRLYSTENDKHKFWGNEDGETQEVGVDLEYENEAGRYGLKDETNVSKGIRIALGAEFALACALCGAIFLTNVFVPGSAINTFFRSLTATKESNADARPYTEFTLDSVVGDFSDAELNLSPTGILSFTDEGCVYPAANGTVSEVRAVGDFYSVKISYSDSFTSVIDGLSHVYYAVGESVKANVPVGYSSGENEVQMTMYSYGELLNCFELTEENCLAWVTQE